MQFTMPSRKSPKGKRESSMVLLSLPLVADSPKFPLFEFYSALSVHLFVVSTTSPDIFSYVGEFINCLILIPLNKKIL